MWENSGLAIALTVLGAALDDNSAVARPREAPIAIDCRACRVDPVDDDGNAEVTRNSNDRFAHPRVAMAVASPKMRKGVEP